MLSNDVWAPLRAAVPSFEARWSAFTSLEWYADDPTYGVSELARHLVSEAHEGRTAELPAFFDALDALLNTEDESLYNVLTIGLLEDIVHEADRQGVSLEVFHRAATGDHALRAWEMVVAFLRGDMRPRVD